MGDFIEREKGLAKGKILSKKRIKVLFVLNIILSVIMAILLLKNIYDKNYSNITALLAPLIIITYNFYFLNLNIKERKRLGEN
ncbi:hypothetical protein [Clostridium perfringens]|uniref:hypothetical protein n=1 Tax=Clostridium perfringens TaxID=1502 RepID=UPI001FAD53D8|nr:hypothetical protein [Clostridium perfringens]